MFFGGGAGVCITGCAVSLTLDRHLICTAIPYCGPPHNAAMDLSSCTDFFYGDHCFPKCAKGYVGHATAFCNLNGHWEYGGSCVGVPGNGKGFHVLRTLFTACAVSMGG